MKIGVAVPFTVAALAGCVSTHNAQTDGENLLGGGYWESEVRNGLYRIDAKSNFAWWADYTGARLTWKLRADQLCGSSEYEQLEVREYEFVVGPGYRGLPAKIAEKPATRCARARVFRRQKQWD